MQATSTDVLIIYLLDCPLWAYLKRIPESKPTTSNHHNVAVQGPEIGSQNILADHAKGCSVSPSASNYRLSCIHAPDTKFSPRDAWTLFLSLNDWLVVAFVTISLRHCNSLNQVPGQYAMRIITYESFQLLAEAVIQ